MTVAIPNIVLLWQATYIAYFEMTSNKEVTVRASNLAFVDASNAAMEQWKLISERTDFASFLTRKTEEYQKLIDYHKLHGKVEPPEHTRPGGRHLP